MPRPLRLEYTGVFYHVMSRGNRGEAIFRDRKDYEAFVGTLAEACGKTGWQVHDWCLMHDHFHLVIETPGVNLVVGMKWLLGVYTDKVKLAGRVRQETTISLKWIANRLKMGSWTYPSNLLGVERLKMK